MAVIRQFVDRDVRSGGISLATRDYGGAGRPMVLIHGACRNLEDWAKIVPYLSGDHRIIAMDMRSHGRSEEGPWTWEAVLSDIDAIVESYGLIAPVIVGHSLGGMIAAMYAATRNDCAAAVNIDGHAAGPDDRLLGMEPAAVRNRWAQVNALNVRILPGGGVPVDAGELPTIRKTMTELWIGLGVPPVMESASLDRAMRRLSDGRLLFRPSAAFTRPMLTEAFNLDLFGIYRRISRPLLIFNGVGAEADDMPGVPWWRAFVSAYHEAVRVGLEQLVRGNARVEVDTVDDTHYLFVKQPERTAERIKSFVSRAVERHAQ